MNHSIHIQVNRTKDRLTVIGALAFMIAGIFFITRPFWFIRSDDPTVIKVIGYLCVVFFGLYAVLLFRKLMNKKEGLWIDGEGLTDHSSGIAAGRIAWRDVKKIRVEQVARQPFIMLDIKDPLPYLQQQQNPVKKRAMELNYQLYKTPVAISAQFLTIGSNELLQLLEKAFKESKGKG